MRGQPVDVTDSPQNATDTTCVYTHTHTHTRTHTQTRLCCAGISTGMLSVLISVCVYVCVCVPRHSLIRSCVIRHALPQSLELIPQPLTCLCDSHVQLSYPLLQPGHQQLCGQVPHTRRHTVQVCGSETRAWCLTCGARAGGGLACAPTRETGGHGTTEELGGSALGTGLTRAYTHTHTHTHTHTRSAFINMPCTCTQRPPGARAPYTLSQRSRAHTHTHTHMHTLSEHQVCYCGSTACSVRERVCAFFVFT